MELSRCSLQGGRYEPFGKLNEIGFFLVRLRVRGRFDGVVLVGSSNGLPATVPAVPLPTALPLFASGLGALGLLGWRKRRKNAAAIAGT